MENLQENRYVKLTQKDYTMSFKLQIVKEIEQGVTTISRVKKRICDSITRYNCTMVEKIW